MKLKYLKISGYKGLNFESDFSDESGKVVITGVNGSGKSTLIEAIELLLSNQSQPNSEIVKKITETAAIFHIKVTSSENEVNELNKIIALNTDFNYQEIEEQLKTIFVGEDYVLERRLKMNRLTASRNWSVKQDVTEEKGNFSSINPNIINNLRNYLVKRVSNLKNVDSPIIDKANYNLSLQELLPDAERDESQGNVSFNLNLNNYVNYLLEYNPSKNGEKKIVELLSKYSDLLSPIKIVRDRRQNSEQETFRAQKNDNIFELSHLSSGQKQALTLFTIVDVWKRLKVKPILLFDEPEDGLHPGLVTKLFKLINEDIEEVIQKDGTFIIATHSSELVSVNPKNIYRIVTYDNKDSRLVAISNLEERASLFDELGIHFHMDFVAQNLVFVESNRIKKHGLSDDLIYQELIDPAKESVYFTLVPKGGPKKNVESFVKEFKKTIVEMLGGGDSKFIFYLVDKDNDGYEEGKNTPFRHVEYLFICRPKITIESLRLTGIEFNEDLFSQCVTKIDVTFKSQPLEANSKCIWNEILNRCGLLASSKVKRRAYVEKEILAKLRTSDDVPEELKSFIKFYKEPR